jgi:hypothetical protein
VLLSRLTPWSESDAVGVGTLVVRRGLTVSFSDAMRRNPLAIGSTTEGGSHPTIKALLMDGPLGGNSVEVEPVEGRPAKTIDVPGADGATYRYCLAQWVQQGASAEYTFLYPV